MTGLNASINVDANQAKQEIKSFNEQLKHSEAVLKLTTKELEAQGDAAGLLAAKQDALNKQIKLQTDISNRHRIILDEARQTVNKQAEAVDEARKAYERSLAAKGEHDAETKKLAASLAIAEKAHQAAGKSVVAWMRDLEKSEAKTRVLEATLQQTTREIEGKAKAVNALGRELEANTQKVSTFGEVLKANLVADAITGMFKSMSSNLSGYLSDGARMAEQFAVAQGQLELVMRNTMGAAGEQVDAIRELTLAQQELGVVSQNAQLSGAQQLSVNMQNTESLRALIPVMNDLVAQQYGINAGQQQVTRIATDMRRVLDGNVRAMERLGFAFNETQKEALKYGNESERVAVLIEVITNSVGGMNRALAETDVGRQAQLNNVLAETQMRIGEIWNSLRAEFSAEMLPAAEAFFGNLLQHVEDNRDNIAALMNMLQGLVSFLLENSRTVVTALGAVGGAVAGIKIAAAVQSLQTWIIEMGKSITAMNAKRAALKSQKADWGMLTVATNTQTAANAANTASVTKLTVAKKALNVALKASPLIGALLVPAVIGLVRSLGNANDEFELQTRLIRDLTNEYHNLRREAEDVARQLENVNNRIDELIAKDSPELIDQQELERLILTREEMEKIVLMLQDDIADAGRDLAIVNVEQLTGENGIFERLERSINYYNQALESTRGTIGRWERDTDGMRTGNMELGVTIEQLTREIRTYNLMLYNALPIIETYTDSM